MNYKILYVCIIFYIGLKFCDTDKMTMSVKLFYYVNLPILNYTILNYVITFIVVY